MNLLPELEPGGSLRHRRLMPSVLRDHPIDDSVLLRLFRAHEVIALGVVANLLEVLPGVLGDDLVEAPADVDDLVRMYFNIGRLPLKA